MAITEYEEYTAKRPVELTCDVCKTSYKLSDEYERKYKGRVEIQMAVLKYSYPVGSYGERTETKEVHCCSFMCLAKALKHVPFGANISIPSGGIYNRQEDIKKEM